MPDKTLGLRISEVIWEHCPGVTAGDAKAALAAAAEVAGVLGCLVAMITHNDMELEKDLRVKIDGTIGKVAADIRVKAVDVTTAGHC